MVFFWENYVLFYQTQHMSSKSRTFQNLALLKNSIFKISYFSKSCTFEKLNFQNLVLSKSRTFKTRTFYRIPCLFQNFRVFENSPVQSSSRIPHKNSVFFQKFPVPKKVDFTNSVFFSKNSVFYKIPRFSDFLNLKKNHVFLYKNIYLQVKSIYLQIKNIYKRQGFILCIIFTVFSSFFSLCKKTIC